MLGRRIAFGGVVAGLALSLAVDVRPQTLAPIAPPFDVYSKTLYHATPAWSPDDRELFYNTLLRGQAAGNLFRVSASGGQTQRFFKDEPFSTTAAWSPDGKRLALAWQGQDGKRIWTCDTAGNDLHQVSRGTFGYDLTPAWSPDGTVIAYTAVSARGERVMLVPSEGGQAKEFAKGVRPRFSPDGASVVFTGLVPDSGQSQHRQLWAAFIKSVESGEARMLTATQGQMRGWASGADWSPAGREIVFVRHLEGGAGAGSDLLFVDVDHDRIVRTIRVAGTAHDPAWSHDGTRIAYMLQSPAHSGEIHVVDLKTGKTRRITEQTHHGSSRLVFYKSTGGHEVPAYLFEPAKGKAANRAGLIWVHGGEPGTGSIDGNYDPLISYFVGQGFVVLAPNYRGSIGWSDKVARVNSPNEILEDLQAAARYLANKSLADRRHLGLVGFSFGGCLSLLAAGKFPDLFSAVVDFSGPTDLAALYRQSEQPRAVMVRLLGGTPDEKPEVYRALSPLSYARHISSPVLIVHGTSDKTILYAHSTAMTEALRNAGRDVRLLTLGSDHGYSPADELRAYPEAAAFLVRRLLAQ